MEQLTPDQRAVLSLVLTQRKSYGEVASMLGISELSVRERAHSALDALAAGGGHAGGAPIQADTVAGARAHSDRESPASGGPPTPVPHLAVSGNGAPAAPGRSSKTGGALLLGAIVAAAAVAAILLSSGGKGSSQSASSTPTHTAARPATASKGSTAAEVHLDKRFSLAPTLASSKASGEGLVVSQGNKRAFYVTARGLPPSLGFFYAVWLYNSPSDSWPLGRAPNVSSNGRLEGGGPLTAPHPASFHRLVITRETNAHPSAPGEIVLSGPFGLR